MKFKLLAAFPAVMLMAAMTLGAAPVRAQVRVSEDATFHKSRLKRAQVRKTTGGVGYEVVFHYVDGTREACILDGTVDVIVEYDNTIRGSWARAHTQEGSYYDRPFCIVAVHTKAAKQAWETILGRYDLPSDILPEEPTR